MSPDRRDLRAPLPDNAISALVEIDGDKGRIEIVGLGGKKEKRKVSADDARAYIAETERLHAADAAFTERAKQKAADEAGARAATAASFDLACRRCDGGTLVYEGRLNVLASERPEEATREEGYGIDRRRVAPYEEYACDRCGTVELFKPGRLPHPLSD